MITFFILYSILRNYEVVENVFLHQENATSHTAGHLRAAVVSVFSGLFFHRARSKYRYRIFDFLTLLSIWSFVRSRGIHLEHTFDISPVFRNYAIRCPHTYVTVICNLSCSYPAIGVQHCLHWHKFFVSNLGLARPPINLYGTLHMQ